MPGARLLLGAELTGTYTDNFFYQPKSVKARDAFGVELKPSIGYSNSSPRLDFRANLKAALAKFDVPGNADDYRDLSGEAGIGWTPALRHRLGYAGSVVRGHDPFGLDRTAGSPLATRSLDKWTQENYALSYNYGTPGGSYAVESVLGLTNKSYYTNRSATQFLDYDTEAFQVTGFYNYSPKTKALLEVRAAHINYGADFPGFPSRSGDEYRVHTGVRWQASAKTSGDVRIGYVTRTYRSDRPTFRGLDWKLSADWTPVAGRRFLLETSRTSLESYDVSSFIDVRAVSLQWTENWTRRLSSNAKVGYAYADFVDTSRRDKGITGALYVEYLLMRKLTALMGYDFQRRLSSVNFLEFDRNSAFLGLRAYY